MRASHLISSIFASKGFIAKSDSLLQRYDAVVAFVTQQAIAYWIGAHHATNTDQFVWEGNGQAVAPPGLWAQGFPQHDDSGTPLDCAYLDSQYRKLQNRDCDCDEPSYFLCGSDHN